MDDFSAIVSLDKEKQFNIEIGTQLHMEVENISYPLKSVFVGMKRDDYVIITPPAHLNSIREKLYEGNSVVVKYLYEGTVYAFQTSLIGSVSKPVKLVLIKYPRVIQHHELRASKRNQCFIPTQLVFKNAKRNVVMKDINVTGCRCEISMSSHEKVFFQIDDKVTLVSRFPGIGKEQAVSGVVRNIRRSSGKLAIGLKFDDISNEFKKTIANYIVYINDFVN